MSDLNWNSIKLIRQSKPMKECSNNRSAIQQAIQDIGSMDREYNIRYDLDESLKLIGREVIAIGSITEVMTTGREVFKGAIMNSAYEIIMAHNHPFGRLEPSEADYGAHDKIKAIGDIVGIPLVDSLIVNDKEGISIPKHRREKDGNAFWRWLTR